MDDFGQPKFNKQTGRLVYIIRGHDAEQFIGVLGGYGADASGVREIINATNRPPEIARAHIDHACGTCNLRVA
ncbi:hypothetical protein PR018_23700 (plasmid) [Rhizobium rhododendri]|uniref:Putative phage metallopeptidase domain-containing protein n=1 Tax=Rhizobium rhododendri TaxID=2506430 RepID=A0ABY8IND0_9HYPH|nr:MULTISPECIES: putative metallopeptidase [Rhizobium]WFS25243.1 hypothetical protein PR018_23700 [Rhizobium rhododendri]